MKSPVCNTLFSSKGIRTRKSLYKIENSSKADIPIIVVHYKNRADFGKVVNIQRYLGQQNVLIGQRRPLKYQQHADLSTYQLWITTLNYT